MPLDSAANFAKSDLSTGYNSAATSIVLATGGGAKFPTPPFNATWWNRTDYPDPADDPNVEIVRVTANSTDTLTVTRAQESTSATNKNTGGKTYALIAGPTAKLVTDVNALAPLTTKGDLLGFSTVPERVAVGADGTVPMADSSQATGIIAAYPGVGTLRTLKETVFAGITPASYANGTTTTIDGSGYTSAIASAQGTVDIVTAGLQLRRNNTVSSVEVSFTIAKGNTGNFNSIVGEDRFRRRAWAFWVRLASYSYTNASGSVYGSGNVSIAYPKWGVSLRRAKSLRGAPNTATGGIAPSFWWNGAEPTSSTYPGVSTADVYMAYFRTPEILDLYYGTYSGGWPTMDAMTFLGSVQMQTSQFVSASSSGTVIAANVDIFFNLGGPAASSGTYEVVFDRWRITTWE